MPNTRSGTSSTPAPAVSPATPTVGTNTGTPAPAAAPEPPGYTAASLQFAIGTLLREPIDGSLMKALRRDGCRHFMDLLSITESDLDQLFYETAILDEHGGETGQTKLSQLGRPQ